METPVLSYATFYGDRFEDFITTAVSLGYRGVELIPDQSPNLLQELTARRRAAIKRMIRDNGLHPTVHSVFYDINLVSVVPEVSASALKVISDCMDFAKDIDARDVTVHPGYKFPGWQSSAWQGDVFNKCAMLSLQRLSGLAQGLGVFVYLENGSYYLTTKSGQRKTPLHFGIFLDELKFIKESTGENIGLCLDIGKAAASSLEIDKAIRLFSDRPLRIQAGGRWSLDQISHSTRTATQLTVKQVTYEGPREDAEDFLCYCRDWSERAA